VVSLEDQQLTDLLADLDDDPQPLPLEPMVQALDQLKESDLELIELRYFEKRPYREIADLLEITENNAKVKVHRILERIKRRLRS
jgi:RNA polymerase sigma-70 factor (ECF subfamily)